MKLDLAWNLLVLVLIALGSQAAGSTPAPAQSLLVAPGVTEPSINDALLVPPPSAGSGFRDCNNDPSQQGCTTSGLVLVQAPFDPVTACPDTPLLGSGLDTGSIADQVNFDFEASEDRLASCCGGWLTACCSSRRIMACLTRLANLTAKACSQTVALF